ncbi:hypothetical protein [Spirosoma agri]|uniref:Proteophosphoglycan ppg4 n=1 Tax=Spirosoma agri TaxID=1987381 RepID=A0A6M0IMT1_9BACT|nr:hypothetical protein [Spirosoma agri]NEU69182.1 hypothetical protein [Spirosoma agri]
MMNSLATAAFVLLLAGSAVAQQKQPASKTSGTSKKSGTITPVDAARSNPSAANTHDGTMGASTGTGTTLEQNQASNATSARPTSVDPASSVRTSASDVKAKKKAPKSGN